MKEAAQYRQELDAAVSGCETGLADACVSLLHRQPQRSFFQMNQRQFIRVCLAILLLLTLLTVGAFAALRLLTPREVARTLENDAVAALFDAQETQQEPQTVTDGDYTVSLLGTVNGAKLVGLSDSPVEETHSYAVFSAARTDGAPITPEECGTFLFLPLISGYEPARIAPFTMTIGRSAFYLDGIMYTLVDMVDLTPFSDRALWLGLLQSPFPTAEVLGMDEDGNPVYRDGYTGTRAMFRLPADPADADSEKAAALLRQAGLE
jgi:hypothetical protein